MLVESVNDILSLITICIVIMVPLYFILKKVYGLYQNLLDKNYQRLMNEDDWHM